MGREEAATATGWQQRVMVVVTVAHGGRERGSRVTWFCNSAASLITSAGRDSGLFSDYLHKGRKKWPKSLAMSRKISTFALSLNCLFAYLFLGVRKERQYTIR